MLCFVSIQGFFLLLHYFTTVIFFLLPLLTDAFVQIIRDEGVGALWNGTFPSLLLVLNPAIQFMIYEGLKRQLRRGPPREVGDDNKKAGKVLKIIYYYYQCFIN